MARRPPGVRTTPPAGWPAWLVSEREARGWTQRDVFKRARGHFGWGDSSLTLYGDIERGRRTLSADDKTFLAALYGKTPTDVPEPSPEPGSASADLVAAALDRQTRVMEAQLLATDRQTAMLERVLLALGHPAPTPTPITERADAGLDDAEERLRLDRPQSTSPRPRRARGHRGADERPESREAESA